MSTRKNQNSILVLATLGVYLGLVLVGATPQVLAQAAMTRQFDVKDEIEVKDDLDKKPDDVTVDLAESPAAQTDQKIVRSVERFVAKFRAVDSINSLCTTPESPFESDGLRWQGTQLPKPVSFNTHIPLSRIVIVTNLARADLDPLFA